MLTKKQRRSVIRTLIKAYYEYRDLSFLAVCKTKKAALVINRTQRFGGMCHFLAETSKYRHKIEVPGKCPSSFKEHVFWHEFCHAVLDKLHLFSYLEGRSYRDYVTMHEPEYWEPERFCHAFADAMILYRKGIGQGLAVSLEQFFLADSESLSYGQMNWFSSNRLRRAGDKARAERRNIGLRDLDQLIHARAQAAVSSEFQPLLPSEGIYHLFYFQNQFSDKLAEERAGIIVANYRKASWKEVYLEEERLIRWAHKLTDAHAQLSLFEETARADREKVERSFKRFDQACKKFQRT